MNILDPRFRYTSAAATDIRKTFARVRRELRTQTESKPKADESVQQEATRKVRIFKKEAA